MTTRAILGFLGLLCAGLALAYGLQQSEGARTMAPRLWDQVTSRAGRVQVLFEEPAPSYVGDPVFTVEGESFARIGTVAFRSADGKALEIELDPIAFRRAPGFSRATAMTPKGDFGWMAETLLPQALRERLASDLLRLWNERQLQTFQALEGPSRKLLGDLGNILAAELPAAIAAEVEAIREFQAALGEDIVDAELRRVLEIELGRRLEQALLPEVAQLGQAIWDEVDNGDLASILWTATRGFVGLGGGREIRDRFQTLLREKALPVIRARAPRLMATTFQAFQKGFGEPAVQEALKDAGTRLLDHPAFRTLASRIGMRAILSNQALHTRLLSALESAEFRRPFEELLMAADPLLQVAMQDMFTRADRQGMNHQLVQVLRRMVLWKDLRYLLLLNDEGNQSPLRAGQSLKGSVGMRP